MDPSHSGYFGEQKHLGATDHLELVWRTGKSCCFWSCGAHMKNRKILLLLAMWSLSGEWKNLTAVLAMWNSS